MTIDAATVRELFHYDPETGLFRRRVARSNRVRAGEVITSPKPPKGYLYVRIDKRPFYLHRLAFLYMTGEWPKGQADHKNRIITDNRWCNLRDATHSQNIVNSKIRSDNTSGAKGVYFHDLRGKWVARVGKKYLGYFTSKQDAIAAYQSEAIARFGEFATVKKEEAA